jgi:hypothetical protein
MNDQQPVPTPTLALPQRTFKLYDFSAAFGRDAHHVVFIQRESNSEALAIFEENLHEEVAQREVRWFSRVYTKTDLENIQTSCQDILEVFSATNDVVEFTVVLGKIEVQSCVPGGESHWFWDTFKDYKDPNWALGFNVNSEDIIDLRTEAFK